MPNLPDPIAPRMTRQLRQLLALSGPVVAPGAYDGITARMVEQAGFPACYMSGAATAAARGFPDFGLLGLTEMTDNAAAMVRALGVPLVADADNGYGNELNVSRTVAEFEARGVAAIHIEDQVTPKRCGHLDGKEVISRDQFAAHIHAASSARQDPDFVIIARTDARAVHGLDDAIDRANAALDAGADIAFVEAPQSLDEMADIPRRVRGPCLLNMVVSGKTPLVTTEAAGQMGYRLIIVPGLSLLATIRACDDALACLRSTGKPPTPSSPLSTADIFRRLGAQKWERIRNTYSQPR